MDTCDDEYDFEENVGVEDKNIYFDKKKGEDI